MLEISLNMPSILLFTAFFLRGKSKNKWNMQYTWLKLFLIGLSWWEKRKREISLELPIKEFYGQFSLVIHKKHYQYAVVVFLHIQLFTYEKGRTNIPTNYNCPMKEGHSLLCQ